MTIPTLITDLSTTASSNPPAGSESAIEGDNHLRVAYSFIAQTYSEKAPKASPTFTGTVTAAALTTTGNTILGDASTDTLNVGNGGIIKDASGNVGIGATPSAWLSSYKGVDIGTGSAMAAADTVLRLVSNSYIDSGVAFRAKTTGAGALLTLSTGGIFLSFAPSATAGAVHTYASALTVDPNMNVISHVETSAPSLSVNQEMVFSLTSNTNLRVSVRGTDGTTRVANLTLA